MRLVVLALTLALTAGAATAAEWDTINPGSSTMDNVRAQFGRPTSTRMQKTEGYDTASWTYEGTQAPRGIHRIVVEFGLLGAQGFRSNVVRSMRVEPNPAVFNRIAVINAWGEPTVSVRENDADVFFYGDGLLIYFDKDGWNARLMVFTPPQPPPSQSAPR